MKILCWSPYSMPYIGGMEVLLHTLALQLKERGHDVRVLSSNMYHDDFRRLEIDGIPIYLFPFLRALGYLKLGLVKEILQEVNKMIADFSPDVLLIHGWGELPSFFQTRVLEKHKIPFLLTIHGLLDPQSYKRLLCAKLLSMANAVGVVSRSLLEDFIKLELPSVPAQLIYNALIQPKMPVVPVDANSQHIVMVGRLSSEKGFDIAFEAVRNLAPLYPNLRFTAVGGGFMMDELQHKRKEYGLENIIYITGYVPHDEVYHYIDQAAFVLMPSSYESFGLVALEAAQRGRAIIASNVMGLREVVDDKKTGILIEPVTVKELQKAIEFLLNHPEKIREFGEAAVEKAKQFSVENMTNQYEKVLYDITAR